MTHPNDIGHIVSGPADNVGFAFYAGAGFWLGKALELDMAATFLFHNSKRLIADRGTIASEGNFGFDMRYWVSPFPPDPRIGAGIWQVVMLAGFALENVFKAILINASSERVANGKLEGFDHRLVELAQASNLALSDCEIRLCEICTHALVCAGRYPTSMKAKDLAGEWRVDLDHAWSTYKPLLDRSFMIARIPR